MTITLPQELEREIVQRAELLGIEPDEVVRRALARFVQIEPELSAEFEVWQMMSWRAWETVENLLP